MPRDIFDYFPTPIPLVQSILKLPELEHRTSSMILEPGCGTGNWGGVIKDQFPKSIVYGVEINPEHNSTVHYDFWINHNYLSLNHEVSFQLKFDMIFCNPPYGLIIKNKNTDRNLAQKFVRKAWNDLNSSGVMVFLLRLGFLGGQKRFDSLFSRIPPRKVYCLPKRPQFINGHSNDKEFAVYIWDKNWSGETGLGWLEW